MIIAVLAALLSPSLAATLQQAPPGAAVACRTDDDCSLLGECTASGKCECDPGWKGEACGVADLLPLNDTAGYVNASAASWGGRPIFSNGKWHLFVTEIARACPLILFMNNSAVVRAEADAPQGPFVRREVVLPPFHHNPQVVGPTPDGFFLLFSIGRTNAPRSRSGARRACRRGARCAATRIAAATTCRTPTAA